MKILVFTSLYPNNIWPHHGVFVKERITRLAGLPESDLKVFAPVPYFPNLKINPRWKYSQISKREFIEGLEVSHPRYFTIPKVGMPAYGYLMALSLLPTIRRIEREFNFDVIDSHYVYPDGFAAVILGRMLRKPVVITARGTDINLFAGFITIRPLLSYCLRRADALIAVCQALSNAMADLGVSREKIQVIPNGVDTLKFHPIDRKEARVSLGLPQDKKIILSVGGLVERKGFEILIRAMRALRDEHNKRAVSLVIAGEGPNRSQLEELIDSLGLVSSVTLIGDIPHNELYRWYSAADLFCLASSREGWPNVILESLACGTPVVATNIGGIPEIITSSQLGLLCERDERSFANQIAQALAYPWDHEFIVRFAAKHTWDRAAQSVLDVLKSAVALYKEKQNRGSRLN